MDHRPRMLDRRRGAGRVAALCRNAVVRGARPIAPSGPGASERSGRPVRPRRGLTPALPAAWVAALCLAAFAPAAGAAVTVGITPASQTVTPGAEFDVSVTVTQSGSAFNAFDAIVGYTPSALTLVQLSPLSLQEGALMTGACGNRFHQFRRGTDRDTATSVLLCAGASVTGPGQIYRLRFRASNTPQSTLIRLLPGTRFFNAGLAVTPVSTSDATVQIGAPVGVEPLPLAGVPLRLQASPNPSRSLTTLRLETGADGLHELAVCDVLGRVVRRLENGWFAAGSRQVAWDGRDDRGARVPAGLYYARLRGPAGQVRSAVVRLD